MAVQPPPYPSRIIDQNFGMCITPQDIIFPSNNFLTSNYFRPWKWYTQNVTKDFGSTIGNDKDKFQITLDVQHFKPNEISVKVVSKEIVVEGRHEERLDEHGVVSRQFTRRYILPNDCDPEDVTSTLSSDGVLMIISNKKCLKDNLNERKVPIKLCESFTKKQEVESSQITNTETTKKASNDEKKDVKVEGNQVKNKNMSAILKEEHSCLLKPELLMDTTSLTKDKVMETKLETDDLFKRSNDKVGQSVYSTDEMTKMSMDKIGSLATASTEFEMTSKTGKSNIGAALSAELELASETMGKSSIAASSEMSSFQSSETSRSEESSSSFMSAMTSSLKTKSDKTSELFSDTISAALKEAADNM